MRTAWLKVLCVALLAGMLSACGGDDTTETGAIAPVPTGTAQTVSDPNAAVPTGGDVGGSTLPASLDGGNVSLAGGVTRNIFAPIDTPAATTTKTDTTKTDTSAKTTTTSTVAEPVYDTASIELDGQTYSVKVDSVFPSTTQQFTVMSIHAKTVIVRLTAGEFADGSDGITLEKGLPVTLVNNSEGESLTLQLLSVTGSQIDAYSQAASDGHTDHTH